MKIYAIFLSLLLIGCRIDLQRQPEPPPEKSDGEENALLIQAEKDVAAAIEMEAQWRVRDAATNFELTDLSDLLLTAMEKQETGDISEANRLAEKISLLAKLAVEQALENQNSRPGFEQPKR